MQLYYILQDYIYRDQVKTINNETWRQTKHIQHILHLIVLDSVFRFKAHIRDTSKRVAVTHMWCMVANM